MTHSLPTFFNGGGLLLAWLIIGGLVTVGMVRMVRRDRPPTIPHGVGLFGDLEALPPDWVPPRMAIAGDPEPDSVPVQPTPGLWEQPPAALHQGHGEERIEFSTINGPIHEACPICRKLLDIYELDHAKAAVALPGRIPPRPSEYDSFRPL